MFTGDKSVPQTQIFNPYIFAIFQDTLDKAAGELW